MPHPPSRIVCLTEETVETLYLLGEEDRIVGVSGYAVRPPRVRREKPRVSALTSADIPKILSLKPDLVLAFSDMQAGIVADLVRAGMAVHAFNHRDVAGILAMIRTVGALVGASGRAEALVRGYEDRADSPVAALTTAHRYGAEIGRLAEALRLGDADAAIEALQTGGAAVEWVTGGDPAGPIRAAVLPHALAVHDAAVAGDLGPFHALLDVLARPYDDAPEAFTAPASAPGYRTFCGT